MKRGPITAPKEDDITSAAVKTLKFDEAPKEDDVKSAAEGRLQFDDDNLRGEKTTCCLVLSTSTIERREGTNSQASSKRIQAFKKNLTIFHPWLHVDGPLDHSKTGLKKMPFR